jgi:fatty acid desaturase
MMDMIVVEELPEWGDMQLERFVKEDMCRSALWSFTMLELAVAIALLILGAWLWTWSQSGPRSGKKVVAAVVSAIILLTAGFSMLMEVCGL